MNIAMEATEVRQSLIITYCIARHEFCALRSAAEGSCSRQDGMQTHMYFIQEYVNGQLKSSFGDTFIRGNNGKGSALCISLDCREDAYTLVH